MKLVDWDDGTAPDAVHLREDDYYVIIEDNKFAFNLEIGDQVRYLSDIDGLTCYYVVDVEPADVRLNHNLNLVTLEAIC